MSVELSIDRLSAEDWAATAALFSDHNIYQTWAFARQSATEVGAYLERVIVSRGGAPIGMAAVRVKRVPVIGLGVGYIYRGPLWRLPQASPADLGVIFDALYEEYAMRRGLQLRIAPAPGCNDWESVSARSRWRPRPGVVCERTLCLDLTRPLPELRRSMAQKWRNGLNQAERQDLTMVEGTCPGLMADFEALYGAMRARKRFESGVSIGSFRELQANLSAKEKPLILLARHDGEAVAGHVSSTIGETCVYLLGASNELGRRTKASYLLQWRAVERAKLAGARVYDLGGIDPVNNPGVYHFKAGMGGYEVAYPPTLLADGKGAARFLAPVAERAYRAWRGLRKPTEAIGT